MIFRPRSPILERMLGAGPRRRRPTHIQTLIFDKDDYTAGQARRWAGEHDFKSPRVDEERNTYRLRQRRPGDFRPQSFRTIDLTEGVQAVIGHLKGLAHDPGCQQAPAPSPSALPPAGGSWLEGANVTLTNHPAGIAHTKATIRKMAELTRKYSRTFPIRSLATRITHDVPSKQRRQEIEAIYKWLRDNIRYRQDPVDIEWLQTPERTVKEMAGDCDDIATLGTSLCEALGHPTRFITVGPAHNRQAHIAAQCFDGYDWITLDPVLEPPANSTAPRPDLGKFGRTATGAARYWNSSTGAELAGPLDIDDTAIIPSIPAFPPAPIDPARPFPGQPWPPREYRSAGAAGPMELKLDPPAGILAGPMDLMSLAILPAAATLPLLATWPALYPIGAGLLGQPPTREQLFERLRTASLWERPAIELALFLTPPTKPGSIVTEAGLPAEIPPPPAPPRPYTMPGVTISPIAQTGYQLEPTAPAGAPAPDAQAPAATQRAVLKEVHAIRGLLQRTAEERRIERLAKEATARALASIKGLAQRRDPKTGDYTVYALSGIRPTISFAMGRLGADPPGELFPVVTVQNIVQKLGGKNEAGKLIAIDGIWGPSSRESLQDACRRNDLLHRPRRAGDYYSSTSRGYPRGQVMIRPKGLIAKLAEIANRTPGPVTPVTPGFVTPRVTPTAPTAPTLRPFFQYRARVPVDIELPPEVPPTTEAPVPTAEELRQQWAEERFGPPPVTPAPMPAPPLYPPEEPPAAPPPIVTAPIVPPGEPPPAVPLDTVPGVVVTPEGVPIGVSPERVLARKKDDNFWLWMVLIYLASRSS